MSAESTAATTGTIGDHSTHRLVQFSDGVFTVALTLLVIDIAVPTIPNGSSEAALVAQLGAQLPNILAFLLTFWVVAAYWLTHQRYFQLIRRYDGRLLVLNLFFLLTVCFIPWPTAVLGHYGDYFVVWVLYAVSMSAMGIAVTVMWLYASDKPSLVDDVSPELRRYFAARAAVQPAVFLLSIPIAAVSLPLGQLTWIAIFAGLHVLRDRFGPRVEARYRTII